MDAAPTSFAVALERLVALRWIALAMLAVVVAVVRWVLGVALPSGTLALILAVQAGLNLLSRRRLHAGVAVGAMEYGAHLLADTTAWGVLLFLAGGWYNPFVSLLLVPVVLAAATLPKAGSVALAGYAVLAYSLLARYHLSLPISGEHAMRLHLLGMWFNFVLSAVLVVGFMLRLRGQLTQRDAALDQAREAALRDERVLALGVQAASTVHELATPLNTLAVGLDNLRLLRPGEQGAELQRMEQQVARCRRVLQQLRETGREGPRVAPLGGWLEDIVRDWQVVRPDSRLELAVDAALAKRQLRLDDALRQAIFNLLDNAARASAEPLRMAARLEREAVELEIVDRGPGYEDATPAHALGIGLLLTRAALERLGGDLQLGRHSEGGTRALIRLPLYRMSAGHA